VGDWKQWSGHERGWEDERRKQEVGGWEGKRLEGCEGGEVGELSESESEARANKDG